MLESFEKCLTSSGHENVNFLWNKCSCFHSWTEWSLLKYKQPVKILKAGIFLNSNEPIFCAEPETRFWQFLCSQRSTLDMMELHKTKFSLKCFSNFRLPFTSARSSLSLVFSRAKKKKKLPGFSHSEGMSEPEHLLDQFSNRRPRKR